MRNQKQTNFIIIGLHLTALLIFYAIMMVASAGFIQGNHMDVYGLMIVGMLNIALLLGNFIVVSVVSFIPKISKPSKIANWIGFGLMLLLSFPSCFLAAYIVGI